jgi:hypothetical protein
VKQITGVSAALLLLALASAHAYADQALNIWAAGSRPTAGGIEKTGELANKYGLHYAKTGNPDKADFELHPGTDVDSRCYETPHGIRYWRGEEVGLDPGDTVWECNGMGTMTQGSYTSTYTPGDALEDGIGIRAKVGDSDTGFTGEESEFVSWLGTTGQPRYLWTFRVGVKFSAQGDYWIWEDDAQATKYSEEDNLYDLLGGAEGITVVTLQLDEPGKVMAPVKRVGRTITYKAVAEREGGEDCSSYHAPRGVTFAQLITLVGRFEIACEKTGKGTPGPWQQFSLDCIGASTPYAAPITTLIWNIIKDDFTACDAYVAGQTVIENVTESIEMKEEVHYAEDAGYGVASYSREVSIDGLTAWGHLINISLGSERKAGTMVELMVGGYDDLQGGWIKTQVKPCSMAVRLEFGCSRPVYE